MCRWTVRAGILICVTGSLVSCGGSGSNRSASAFVIGGADGAVFNRLGQTYNVQSANGGDGLSNASLIIVDGDHISPGLLSSMNGLKSAIDKGVPIVAVDADAALKKSLSHAIGAPLATGESSYAMAYRKVIGDGDPYFQAWEIPSGTDKIQETSLKVVDGVIVAGPTTTSTTDKQVSQASVDRLVASMTGVGGRPSRAPRPPQGAPAFFTTYNIIDGSNYNTLSNQYSGRDVTYTFMGIRAGKIGQPDTDYFYVTTDGQFSTGPLTGGNFDDGILKIGWFQDSVKLESQIGPQTDLGENIRVESSSGYYGDRTISQALLFYRDRAGNVLPWYYSDQQSFDHDRWTVDASYVVGSTAQYELYQAEPYDKRRENYLDAWSGNNPPQPKSFPSGSTSLQTCYFSTENTISPHLEGILPLSLNITKTFARLGQQFFIQGGFFVPIPTAKVTLTDGSPRPILLDFDQTIFDDDSNSPTKK